MHYTNFTDNSISIHLIKVNCRDIYIAKYNCNCFPAEYFGHVYVDEKAVVTIVASMDLHALGEATIAYNAVSQGGYYSRGLLSKWGVFQGNTVNAKSNICMKNSYLGLRIRRPSFWSLGH